MGKRGGGGGGGGGGGRGPKSLNDVCEAGKTKHACILLTCAVQQHPRMKVTY